MISQRNYVQQNTQNKSRKTRDGDWICIKCSNYNYAFRDICNRCHVQNKNKNQQQMQAIGKQNYGENSFPSVVFINVNNQINEKNYNHTNYQNYQQQTNYQQIRLNNYQQMQTNNYQQIQSNNYQQIQSNNYQQIQMQPQNYQNYNNTNYYSNEYQFYPQIHQQKQQYYQYNNSQQNQYYKKQDYLHKRVFSMPLQYKLLSVISGEQQKDQIIKDDVQLDQLNSLIPQNIWISSLIDE